MSVAAQKWAWAQNLPLKPKFILVTLADQTDEQTGRVCYQESSVEFFTKKCAVTRTSFFRCISALIRNGYIARESGKGRGHNSKYWLKLDREVTADELWFWGADAEAEPQDIDKGAKTEPLNDDDKRCQERDKKVPLVGLHKESCKEPKYQGHTDEKPLNGFSRQAQDLERAKTVSDLAKPKLEDGEMPGWTFVIEGTRWWDLLVAHHRQIGRPLNSRQPGSGKYRGKTGRYVRNEVWQSILKPHSTTGPPDDPLADETAAQLQKTG